MSDNEVRKDEIYYRQPLLRYEVYNLKSRKKVLDVNPWHWHDEFEVIWVRDGKVTYKTSMKEYVLQKDDVLFINARVIHSLKPSIPSDDMFMSVHFFDDIFLSGGRGNAVDVKYVDPVINNADIDMIYMESSTPRAGLARKLIEENILLKRNKGKFWELDLRTNISELWKMIMELAEQEAPIAPATKISVTLNDRLRAAITFIQDNYKEHINLDDIASYVHVSTRECNRMFMKYLSVTPMNYLHSVRLQKATSMLLDTNKSIFDIATENGYTSNSHFGKRFKERYNATPKEYRERMKNENLIK